MPEPIFPRKFKKEQLIGVIDAGTKTTQFVVSKVNFFFV